ncbi:DUF4198 domain-containing protein [Novosphingobium album (ex Liu et al. 2023)]|uniref:DUF4198 domain-containing protein n=1 Tax=Novosphingobium album (ex Liu et al. 2023) TaxID=3031130 RepID=A0ABT5WN78_9SPHN|nr:DUF4198 domain-containing protein [Novosphingobium album (ex Liu et al. 2023)]MDE8651495.1 DUF4198 domain-containing protein [Novosphingobium album (ex Liu et al. 2023)]
MLRKSLLAAAIATMAVSAPAHAHRAWLLPSITVLSDLTQMVTVDAGASTDPFVSDHAPMNVDGIQVWAPDGSMGKIENVGKGRYRTTFDVAIDKPGTWRIGMASSSVMGSFKVNGEDWMVGGRRRGPGGPGAGGAGAGGPGAGANAAGRPMGATPPAGGEGPGEGGPRRMIDPSHMVASVDDIPAGATDLNLTQMDNRNEFFVTAGEPTDTLFKPTGKGLEMVPITPPTDLVANEPGKFRFLVDGKPAPDLKVTVIPGGQRYREADHAQELTTDRDGVLTVAWPVAGFYWVNASLADDKPSVAKASKRRMSYTVTLEVVAP